MDDRPNERDSSGWWCSYDEARLFPLRRCYSTAAAVATLRTIMTKDAKRGTTLNRIRTSNNRNAAIIQLIFFLVVLRVHPCQPSAQPVPTEGPHPPPAPPPLCSVVRLWQVFEDGAVGVESVNRVKWRQPQLGLFACDFGGGACDCCCCCWMMMMMVQRVPFIQSQAGISRHASSNTTTTWILTDMLRMLCKVCASRVYLAAAAALSLFLLSTRIISRVVTTPTTTGRSGLLMKIT